MAKKFKRKVMGLFLREIHVPALIFNICNLYSYSVALAAIIYMPNSCQLIKAHCPNLFALLVRRGYNNWDKLDNRIEEQLLSMQTVKTNLVRLLLLADEDKNSFLKSFANHIDSLIAELLLLVPNKEKGIWKSLEGKFENIHDWNFLNPIGELSVLKKLLDSDLFDLVKFEAEYPNGRSKDFLLRSKKDNSNKLVEVVNIHLPIENGRDNDIKRFILKKLKDKIQRETENVTERNLLDALIICPVVWYLTTDDISENITFFSDFANSQGASESFQVRSLGFCTYVKTNDNRFIFGEASSIFNKYKF